VEVDAGLVLSLASCYGLRTSVTLDVAGRGLVSHPCICRTSTDQRRDVILGSVVVDCGREAWFSDDLPFRVLHRHRGAVVPVVGVGRSSPRPWATATRCAWVSWAWSRWSPGCAAHGTLTRLPSKHAWRHRIDGG
jgi:hypothetical protein